MKDLLKEIDPLYNTFVYILFIGVINLKRVMGVISTALLTGTMIFGVSLILSQ